MANMKFDAFTLTKNPYKMTIIKADKHCDLTLTYSSVAYFNWGSSIVGKIIQIEWRFMCGTDFSTLDTLYQNDTTTVFDPQDGEGHTYNCKVLNFDGTYHVHLDDNASHYRRDVIMKLLIISQAS